MGATRVQTGAASFRGRHPLFVMAVGLALTIGTESVAPGRGWLAAAGFACLMALAAGWRGGLLALAVCGAGLAAHAWRISTQAGDEKRFADLGVREVEGRLLEDARGEEGVWSGPVRLTGGDGLEGREVWWVGYGECPVAGTRLRASGVFRSLREERNPGMAGRGESMRAEGIVAVFHASEMRAERRTDRLARNVAAFRAGFREAITSGLDPEGRAALVVRAVVLGDRSHDSPDLIQSFRQSGTLHVFTVSGLHVAMMGGMAWFVLKWLGVGRRAAILVVVPLMFSYAWLAGNGPAALRSAWMGSVFLAAFGLRRRPDLLNSLGAVLLATLLWDGRMLAMPGVQLSYGVVAAIGLGAAWATRGFAWIAAEEKFLPMSEYGRWRRISLSVRRKLAGSLGVSTAAWLGSTPLTAYHFGLVTPISIVATVALVPQVFVILGVALVSAQLYPLWPGGSRLLNRGNGIMALACAESAGFFASRPGAWFSTRTPDEQQLIIYDLDYGATAACFATPERSAVLIGAGGRYSFKREVAPSLRRQGIEPDSVIFTHQDAAHLVPREDLLEVFPLRQVAVGIADTGSPAIRDWLENEAGTRVLRMRRGDRMNLGEQAWAEVLLSPMDGILGSRSDDQVMVFKIHWKGWKILWMSDAGSLSEENLLESGQDLAADLLVAGMHDADFSLSEAFVAAVNPRAMVLANDPSNELSWLRGPQKEIWRKRGITVLDQADTGGVTLTISQGGRLVIASFLTGDRLLLEN